MLIRLTNLNIAGQRPKIVSACGDIPAALAIDKRLGSIRLFIAGDRIATGAASCVGLAVPIRAWSLARRTALGEGVLARSVGTVVEWASRAFGLGRTFADLFTSNAASASVLEKNGSVLEGVKRCRVIKAGVVRDPFLDARTP